jgi:hypothetical protein
MSDFLHKPGGQGGDAAEPLHQVKSDAFGFEQVCNRTIGFKNNVTLFYLGAIRKRITGDFRIAEVKYLCCNFAHTGGNKLLFCHEFRPAGLAVGENCLRGDIAKTNVLLKELGNGLAYLKRVQGC